MDTLATSVAIHKECPGSLDHEVFFYGDEEGTSRHVLESSMIWDTPKDTRARHKFRAGHQLFLPLCRHCKMNKRSDGSNMFGAKRTGLSEYVWHELIHLGSG